MTRKENRSSLSSCNPGKARGRMLLSLKTPTTGVQEHGNTQSDRDAREGPSRAVAAVGHAVCGGDAVAGRARNSRAGRAEAAGAAPGRVWGSGWLQLFFA